MAARVATAALFAVVATMRLLGQQSPAQTPAPPITADTLPPSEIYQQLLVPFNRIREDMANWSDTELQAFQILVASAKQECVRIEATPHEGDEELALAQLCAVGRDWDGTYSAARWYTRKDAPPEDQLHLARGYALLLQADLNLQRRESALEHLRELTERVPFSAETAAVFRFSVNAMEVQDLEHAVSAALLEQPHLLAAVIADSLAESSSVGEEEADAWHTLSLLREAGRTETEAAEKTKLLDALEHRTATPAPVEAYRAELGRRAYEWLGSAVPDLHVLPDGGTTNAALGVKKKPALLILQTDGAADVAALSSGVDSLRRRLPPSQEVVLVLSKRVHPDVAQRSHIPPSKSTVYSSADLFALFSVQGAPLFLLRDAAGRIAFLGEGSATWLNPQMQAEMLLSRTLPQSAH